MSQNGCRIVVLGLSLTSSWGNGHATTFRSLLKALAARGHDILFLERDVPWYRENRDLKQCEYCRLRLYANFEELRASYADDVRSADAVIVGSYVPDGIAVGQWVTDTAKGVKAFYDIDTPITLAAIEQNNCEYLSPELIPRYDLYLSFTGGPILEKIEQQYGSPCARLLTCSVDPSLYYPEETEREWEIGYLGTYSADRQPKVESLLLQTARAFPERPFAVAGSMYPADVEWPPNLTYIHHLPPAEHRHFYNSQRYTLNITRRDMVAAGYSPSVRLFEAAACGTPIITDTWPGLDSFFTPGTEILPAAGFEDVREILRTVPEEERVQIGQNARRRVLDHHTAAHRAGDLESYIKSIAGNQRSNGNQTKANGQTAAETVSAGVC